MAYFRKKQAEWNVKHGYGPAIGTTGNTVSNIPVLPTHRNATTTDAYGNTTTGTGLGGHHNNMVGTGTGLTAGHNATTTTVGPHNSNVANKLDPRVDSDLDGSRTYSNGTGTGITGSHHNRNHHDRHYNEKTGTGVTETTNDGYGTRRSGGGLGGLFGRKNKSAHNRITNSTGFDVMSSDFNRKPSFGQWLKFIWLDLLTMAAMGAVGLGVYNADPAPSRSFPITFVDGEVVYPQFAYPIRTEIVPIWEAALLASLIPIAVILLMQIRIRSFWDVNNAILGLLYSLITAAVFQVFIKWLIGGLRPHFLYVCAPDLTKVGAGGQGFGNIMFQRDVCTGDRAQINDSLESMPSGHSTAAFAGFVFLYLYLNAKLKVFSNYHPAFWKMILLYAPLLGACLIAGSLTIDEYHNWYDCFAGAVIGTLMAFSAYRMVYASVWDFRFNHIPLTRHTPFSFGAGQAGAGGFETAIATRKAGWGYEEAYGGAPFDAAHHLRGTMAGFNNAVNADNHPSQHKSGGLLGGMMHKNNHHDDGVDAGRHPSTATTVNQSSTVYDDNNRGRKSFGHRDGVYDNTTGTHNANTTSQANDPRSTNYGPHKSNMMNKLDPRVDSNLDGSRTTGNNDNTTHTHNHSHNHNSAIVGGTVAGAGLAAAHHHDHNRHNHDNTYDTTSTKTTGLGNNSRSTNYGPHNSNLANRLDPRVDSTLDASRTTDNTNSYDRYDRPNSDLGVNSTTTNPIIGNTTTHRDHNPLHHSNSVHRQGDIYAPGGSTINTVGGNSDTYTSNVPFTSSVTNTTGTGLGNHHYRNNSLGRDGQNVSGTGILNDQNTRDIERGNMAGDTRYSHNSRSLERKALRQAGGL